MGSPVGSGTGATAARANGRDRGARAPRGERGARGRHDDGDGTPNQKEHDPLCAKGIDHPLVIVSGGGVTYDLQTLSIHFDRALAASTATIPKCSGPIF